MSGISRPLQSDTLKLRVPLGALYLLDDRYEPRLCENSKRLTPEPHLELSPEGDRDDIDHRLLTAARVF